MMRVVVATIACILAVSQAASVKKRSNNNGPQTKPDSFDTSQIMGDINDAVSSYESVMRWVQDMEQTLGNQGPIGQSSMPDLSAIQGDLAGAMAEYSNYMKEMEKVAKQLRQDAMRQGGIAKRNMESAGYPVGEMPNFPDVPDVSALFNGNMGAGPAEGMPHGIPDLSALYGNMGANQGLPDMSGLNVGSNPETNPEFAKAIENFNKQMGKKMKAFEEEMMRNLQGLGLAPELPSRRR